MKIKKTITITLDADIFDQTNRNIPIPFSLTFSDGNSTSTENYDYNDDIFERSTAEGSIGSEVYMIIDNIFYINGIKNNNDYITVDGHKYMVGKTTDNKKSIIKSTPYDLQEYHWAYRKGHIDNDHIEWVVVRSGRKKGTIITSFLMSDQREEEIVAEKLIEFDKEANLQPHIDRT